MKVLLVNGSCNKNGSTKRALNEISKILIEEGVETEFFDIGNAEIRDCCGCLACRDLGKCVFEDGIVNDLIEKAKTSDGFVFGTPVYYAHPSARILAVLDRAFYAAKKHFAFKPASTIAVARRSGTTASLDVLNKYLTVSNMPLVSSNYWNNIHGKVAADLEQDLEGLQIMRILARNLAWVLKCIELGKNNGIQRPELEDKIMTNYIR